MENTNAKKDAIISARFLLLVSQGATPLEALRQVCGADLVDKMVDDLYHALRAKAGK